MGQRARKRPPTDCPLKAEIQKKTVEIQKKIDRLLEVHLDGLIEKAEYRSKKEILLKKKVELEEEIKKVEQGAVGWLEPCREFLQSAHQAHQVLAEGNFESLIETAALWDAVRTHFQQVL